MINRTSRHNSVGAKNKSQGFTLMEVLIAIVILSVGLLGLASLTVGIINGTAFSKNLSTATTLAQDKMEELCEQDYSGVAVETKGPLLTFPNYNREVVVDTTTLTDMKIVTVTVFWTDRNGEHSVPLKTILSQTE